jgi:hypothetical protein
MLLIEENKTFSNKQNGTNYHFCTPEKGLRSNEERKRAAKLLQEYCVNAFGTDGATFDAMVHRLVGWKANSDVHGNRLITREPVSVIKHVRIVDKIRPPLIYENVVIALPKGFIYARGFSQDPTQLNFVVGVYKGELPNKILDLLCQRVPEEALADEVVKATAGRSTVDKGLAEVIKFLS